MNPDFLPADERFLHDKLQSLPSHWETRRRLAHVLYDRSAYREAAEMVWNAPEIPSNDVDIAFAARILSKAEPRKAIRLLTAVLEMNRGKPIQNMAMANALLHHGLVLQAVRFYGAALEADPSLANPDLEHFTLWTDDEMTLWADFTKRRPKLGELPWMARNPKEALELTARVSHHTTPIQVPLLAAVAGEYLRNELYKQEEAKNAKITPPPAVTIPFDRVDPKYRRYDQNLGATDSKDSDVAASVAPSRDSTVPSPAPVIPTPVAVTPAVVTPAAVAPAAVAPAAVAPTPVAINPAPIIAPRPAAASSPSPPPTATKPLVPPSAPTPPPTRKLLVPGGPPNIVVGNKPITASPGLQNWTSGPMPKKS